MRNAWYGVGVLLLFAPDVSLGPFDHRFLPSQDSAVDAVGWAVTALGLAFAVWSRWTLGRNWSARITLKTEHELIRSGPYGFVRHPIYSGLLVAFLGTALYLGEWRGLIALPVFAVGFWLKSVREEKLLESEFGAEYREYRRETGMLTPRLSRSETALQRS
jgi:protein-S-isoprenylcysteine O-methyltransferase Ste14